MTYTSCYTLLMARIYQPRQRKATQRWDYTVGSDDENWVHPVGYCSGWKEKSEEELREYATRFGDRSAQELKEWLDEERVNKEKYHDNGHATADEAHACYAHYLADHIRLLPPPKDPKTLHKCEECGAFCSGAAETNDGFWFKYFCESHWTHEVARKHFLKSRLKESNTGR